MLLAEELALIAIDPDSGRPALGTRDNLNACLAGLLVAELHLDDRPASPLLDAAGEVVAEAGPKMKAALSAMSRGLDRRLGVGTWDAVVGGLVDAGVLAPTEGVVASAQPRARPRGARRHRRAAPRRRGERRADGGRARRCCCR